MPTCKTGGSNRNVGMEALAPRQFPACIAKGHLQHTIIQHELANSSVNLVAAKVAACVGPVVKLETVQGCSNINRKLI